MARSTRETSTNSAARTSPASAVSISSPASAGGPTPLSSQVGTQRDLFGQPLAPVSRSARPGSGKAKRTPGISGPCCWGSSASATLQRSLANRLLQTTDTDGSPEYVMTWKRRAMPSGAPICRLAARARRTSEADCSGWPTPLADHANGTPERFLERKRESVARTGRSMGICLSDLNMVAQLAGWPTATGEDGERGANRLNKNKSQLNDVAELAGWPTPNVPSGGQTFVEGYMSPTGKDLRTGEKRTVHLQEAVQMLLSGWPTPMAGSPATEEYNAAGNTDSSRKTVELVTGWATPTSRDAKDGACQNANVPINALLGRQVFLSPAETEKPGVLNPAFSLWLMGYPAAWASCGVRAMQSSRKSRRSSSGRSSKPKRK